ncbi:MAG: cold shock and DUF1294 domain-containing protein, partial [Terrimesophilobacter sp.]
LTGVVTNWHDDRGFGFIKADDGGPDLFLHARSFNNGLERPHDGMLVTYESRTNSDGRLRAAQVVAAGEKWSNAPAARKASALILGYVAIAGFAAIVAVEIIFWNMPLWVLAVYGGVSIISILFYWQDKMAAIKGTWRIPEEQLHLLGIVGGWPGGIIAQHIFRHKTQKERFARYFWFTVLLNVLIFVAIGAAIHFQWFEQLAAMQ